MPGKGRRGGAGAGEVGGKLEKLGACKLQTVHEFNPDSSYRHRFTLYITRSARSASEKLSLADLIINSAFRSGYITIIAIPRPPQSPALLPRGRSPPFPFDEKKKKKKRKQN